MLRETSATLKANLELHPAIIAAVIIGLVIFLLPKPVKQETTEAVTGWIAPDSANGCAVYDTTVVYGPVEADLSFELDSATQKGRFRYQMQERRVIRREFGVGYGTDGLNASAGVWYGNIGVGVIGSTERLAIMGRVRF